MVTVALTSSVSAVDAMAKREVTLEVRRAVVGVAPRPRRADGTHHARGVARVLREHVLYQQCRGEVLFLAVGAHEPSPSSSFSSCCSDDPFHAYHWYRWLLVVLASRCPCRDWFRNGNGSRGVGGGHSGWGSEVGKRDSRRCSSGGCGGRVLWGFFPLWCRRGKRIVDGANGPFSGVPVTVMAAVGRRIGKVLLVGLVVVLRYHNLGGSSCKGCY